MQMSLLALGAALSLLTAAPASTAQGGAASEHSVMHDGGALSAVPPGTAGTELIGRPAPAWSFERWIRTAPLSLETLHGKVVLVRWWTDGCHYCAATLPGLETLRTRYADRGLVVIGAYHPKPPREVSDKRILSFADKLGFDGPIAVDREWSTLERYWLGGHPERGWTSVSFLIDRAGNIRWLHGGGEYHLSTDPRHASCDLEYRELEKTLAAVLAEPVP
jgi:thiol-disulfide isomerase/thioredoxin